MPRPGPRLSITGVRLTTAGRAALDTRATAEGITLSELIRRMLKYSTIHMPPGWH